MLQGKIRPQGRAQKTEQPSLQGSFMRAVGRSLKCHKLGSLLRAAGLVSQEELTRALQTQSVTGEQLGAVLVRQGAVSAVQIYRKLAQQWCIKASAAGMALMIQAMTPSAAHADGGAREGLRAQFQVASAVVNPAAWLPATKPRGAYPSLFGSHEVRSDDISAFKKWTGVMERFEDQLKTQGASPRIMMWKDALQKLKDKPAREQIAAVNAYINDVKYISDDKNWKKTDYWATPVEFFSRGGDCEDFAIAKFASLRALGFSSDQLRIAIVQDTVKNIPHALLIVYTDDGVFVLDNQNKKMLEAGGVARYQPIFSITSTSWWLHKTTVS